MSFFQEQGHIHGSRRLVLAVGCKPFILMWNVGMWNVGTRELLRSLPPSPKLCCCTCARHKNVFQDMNQNVAELLVEFLFCKITVLSLPSFLWSPKQHAGASHEMGAKCKCGKAVEKSPSLDWKDLPNQHILTIWYQFVFHGGSVFVFSVTSISTKLCD